MALAVVLGLLSGVMAFIPLMAALRMTRRKPQADVFGPMLVLLAGLMLSFALSFALAILFIAWDKPNGFPFVLAEVLALATTAIAFGIADKRKHEKRD